MWTFTRAPDYHLHNFMYSTWLVSLWSDLCTMSYFNLFWNLSHGNFHAADGTAEFIGRKIEKALKFHTEHDIFILVGIPTDKLILCWLTNTRQKRTECVCARERESYCLIHRENHISIKPKQHFGLTQQTVFSQTVIHREKTLCNNDLNKLHFTNLSVMMKREYLPSAIYDCTESCECHLCVDRCCDVCPLSITHQHRQWFVAVVPDLVPTLYNLPSAVLYSQIIGGYGA